MSTGFTKKKIYIYKKRKNFNRHALSHYHPEVVKFTEQSTILITCTRCFRQILKIYLRNLMDIFCSTSVRSKAVQNSSKLIIWSPSRSASRMVRSAILFSCSSLSKQQCMYTTHYWQKTRCLCYQVWHLSTTSSTSIQCYNEVSLSEIHDFQNLD